MTKTRMRSAASIRNSAFVLALICLCSYGSTSQAAFHSIAESPDVVEFVWTPDSAEAPGAEAGVDLPAIWVALPPGGRISGLSFQVGDFESSTKAISSPDLVQITADWDGPAAESTEPCWIRDRFGAQVLVRPWKLDPDGFVSVARSIRIRATIEDTGEARRIAPARDPFRPVYERVFINSASSRNWHRAPERRATRGSGDYFSSSNDWIRVRTAEEGIHEITGSDLEALGVTLSSIDPSTLRIFSTIQLPLAPELSVDDVPSWMSEIAIAVEEVGGANGVLDRGDRIIFLGHGPDDWYSNKGTEPAPYEDFARDTYENHSVYWLTWGGSFSGEPKRIEEVDGTGASGPFLSTVRDKIHIEENSIYSPRQKDTSSNPAAWEQFWWREFRTNESTNSGQQVTVTLPDAVSTDPVDVFLRFWGDNDPQGVSTIPDHDITVQLNGAELARLQWNGRNRQDLETSGDWLVPGDDQVFRVEGNAWQDSTIVRLDIVLLAFAELEYTRTLLAHDGRLAFFAGGLSGPQPLEVSGLGSGLGQDDVWVFDCSDPAAPTRIRADVASGVARFRAQGGGRYVVSEDALLVPPAFLERDSAPDGGYLRERTGPAQMIIVTADPLLPAAEDFAEYRRTNFPDRATADVAVVTAQDIFDEFSFGRKDPTAIRNFLEFARTNWDGGNPADGPLYVLLVGDAHRDPRELVSTGTFDLVPSNVLDYDASLASQIYEPRFTSDDYYGLLDGPDDTGLDLYVGRLVAQTLPDARTMLNKTKGYEESSALGPWKNEVTLIADDLCQGTTPDGLGTLHLRQTERLAETSFPSTLQQNKIYMIEYGMECIYSNKPDVAADLNKAMTEGTLAVNFTGHGGETQVSDERIFEVSNVGSLTNADRLFLMLTASCSIGKFDTSSESLAEAVIRHAGGGAVAVFAASAVAYATENALMNQYFYQLAFPDSCAACSRPIGEAIAVGKLLLNNNRPNQRKYALHGDPCLALASPQHEIDLTMTDARSGEPVDDLLSRGAMIDLTGALHSHEGTPLDDFDGVAYVEVYDSRVIRVPDPDNPLLRYELQGAPIYHGTARVTDGTFTTRFVVPTSLRTGERGAAQIFVYANDETRDAAGALADLTVPETLPQPSTDVTGPEIEFAFVESGDVIRPEAEYTVALFDSSGINVTGLTQSRSAVLRIEQDGTTIFAEDLSAQIEFGDDFRNATIRHTLPPGLPEGPYDVELRAYDNLNFGSSVRTSFILSGSGEFSFDLGRVYNVPNPTEKGTQFFCEIPEDADVDIQIFTLSGRRIRSLGPARLSKERGVSAGIRWDGFDDDGDRPGNGVYLYKVTATSVRTGESRSEIGRLVVSR